MITLAVTFHDPHGRLHALMETAVPQLAARFDGIAVNASDVAHPPTMALWRSVGAHVVQRANPSGTAVPPLGDYRREAVDQALHMNADHILFCDADRAAHWIVNYPDEMAHILTEITAYDLTVIGRTPRAFAAHPHVQTDTEGIVNRVFAAVSGQAWDITAATRGLSRRAAAAIVQHDRVETVGTDASWPLLLMQLGGYALGYVETEGMEYETADGYADAVAAAGSETAWKAGIDADPRHWLFRLNAARMEVEAMIGYS